MNVAAVMAVAHVVLEWPAAPAAATAEERERISVKMMEATVPSASARPKAARTERE